MCCKFSPSSKGNVEHSAVRCPCQGTTNPGLPKAETLPTTIVPFTPKGPCTQIVDTLALKYLFKEKSIYIYYLGTWTLSERKTLWVSYFRAASKVSLALQRLGQVGLVLLAS